MGVNEYRGLFNITTQRGKQKEREGRKRQEKIEKKQKKEEEAKKS